MSTLVAEPTPCPITLNTVGNKLSDACPATAFMPKSQLSLSAACVSPSVMTADAGVTPSVGAGIGNNIVSVRTLRADNNTSFGISGNEACKRDRPSLNAVSTASGLPKAATVSASCRNTARPLSLSALRCLAIPLETLPFGTPANCCPPSSRSVTTASTAANSTASSPKRARRSLIMAISLRRARSSCDDDERGSMPRISAISLCDSPSSTDRRNTLR